MNSKLKRPLLAAGIVVGVCALVWGGLTLLRNGSRSAVKVYPVTEIGMTEYGGDTTETSGTVTMDKLQKVYLSKTQSSAQVYVTEGQTVKKGDRLLSYDSTLTELDVERARIALERLRLQQENTRKELQQLQLAEDKEKLQQQADALSAKIEKKLAESTDEIIRRDSKPIQPGKPLLRGSAAGTAEDPLYCDWNGGDALTEQNLSVLLPEGEKELYVVLVTHRGDETLGDIIGSWGLHLIRGENGAISVSLAELPAALAAEMIADMDTADALDMLRELPEEKKQTLAAHLDDDTRKDVRRLLAFHQEEIGSRMSGNFVCIPDTLTVCGAMNELVRQAGEHDNISTLYVVDGSGVFAGAIDLKDLIIARENDPLSGIIRRSYPYVLAHERVEDCIDRIAEYEEDSLPVLTEDGRIAGILTAQDLVELVDDAMSDDYAKLGGLTSEEDLREPAAVSMKKRLPWLIVLLFLGMGVSSVVGIFESVVAVLPIVICFQSLVLDMAGNVGTQSLAVTIRVLMDENLTLKEELALLGKEMRVGLLNGGCLGLMALAVLGVYIHVCKGYAWGPAFLISGCVGVSLVVAMVISSLVGTMVPMLFHKIHIDPAVASGPLITTVNDLVAVVTYYGLALLFLVNMFHL